MPLRTKHPQLILGAPLLLVLLLSTVLTTIATPVDISHPNALLSPAGGTRSASEPTIKRQRLVQADLALLDQLQIGDSLALDLFPDTAFRMVIDQVEERPASASSWTGHIVGIMPSQVTLTKWKGLLAANIAVPDAFYQVRHAGNGLHVVRQLDQSAFPPELEPVSIDLPEVPATRSPDAPADDGSTIDVLVLYTGAARLAAGGTAEIETEINLAVAETNASYANSQVNQRLRLVHVDEIDYDETDFNWYTTLDRLWDPGDGYLDRAHALRDAFCADNVMLIVGNTNYCGLAYMMDPVSTAFESAAFSLVSLPCAAGYYSFGHELGHNMAANHDWFVNDSTSPVAHNHGYLNVSAEWRTIMAYNSECGSHGIYCNRLPYWSNPHVSYGVEPLGVVPGTSTACQEGDLNHPDCDAQNQLVLNETASTVSAFRQSAICATEGPLLYDDYLVDDDNGGLSSGNGDGVVDCGETAGLFVDLFNYGDTSITGISASINTADPRLTWLDNTTSDYPAISSQATGVNKDDFELLIAPDLPNGVHPILLELEITATGGGPWSDSFDLPVACCYSVGTPTPITPADNATVKTPVPTFSWSEASNASEYRLEIATDPAFSDIVLDEISPTPAHRPSVALQNESYYWRVAGRNASGGCDLQGDYSQVRSLTVNALKSYIPVVSK
jgi:hypothetical protein